MSEVLFFAEALDEYREANDALDNDPKGEISGVAWKARERALKNLENTFISALKSVLFKD